MAKTISSLMIVKPPTRLVLVFIPPVQRKHTILARHSHGELVTPCNDPPRRCRDEVSYLPS
ncbi:MAG: hypothetical protein ACRET6_11200 [Burkholderiales bacterium]